MNAESTAPLDDLDRKIIHAFQVDGRQSNTDIAKVVGVTETTVRKRVARMVEQDLLEFLAIPTPKAVAPAITALIGLHVELHHLQDLADQVATFPEVRYAAVSSGPQDILMEAVLNDNEHLVRFLGESIGGLSGILSTSTSMILKVTKFTYEWELPVSPE